MRRPLITLALAFAVAAQPPMDTPVRAAFLYFLPAPAGTTLLVFQGNNSAFDHVAANGSQYAWDFTEGATEFPTVASRGGTVIGLRSGSTNTACRDVTCWKDANYVLVDHGDGTAALYLHLATGSVTVTQGQKVEQGAPLGRADSTGFSYGTHLHFMVEKTPMARTAAGWWWTQSVPISFVDAGGAVEDKSYVSANQPAATATATPAPKPTPRPTPAPTPKPTVTPTPTPMPVTGPPPKPTNASYTLVSSKPTGYPGETDWVYGVRWSEPAGIASGFHIYTVSGCYGRANGDACVKVGMQIPPADLHLIGTVAGSAQSFLIRGTTGGVVNIEDVTKAVLVAAFNRFGESKAAIAFTLTCDAALCP